MLKISKKRVEKRIEGFFLWWHSIDSALARGRLKAGGISVIGLSLIVGTHIIKHSLTPRSVETHDLSLFFLEHIGVALLDAGIISLILSIGELKAFFQELAIHTMTRLDYLSILSEKRRKAVRDTIVKTIVTANIKHEKYEYQKFSEDLDKLLFSVWLPGELSDKESIKGIKFPSRLYRKDFNIEITVTETTAYDALDKLYKSGELQQDPSLRERPVLLELTQKTEMYEITTEISYILVSSGPLSEPYYHTTSVQVMPIPGINDAVFPIVGKRIKIEFLDKDGTNIPGVFQKTKQVGAVGIYSARSDVDFFQLDENGECFIRVRFIEHNSVDRSSTIVHFMKDITFGSSVTLKSGKDTNLDFFTDLLKSGKIKSVASDSNGNYHITEEADFEEIENGIRRIFKGWLFDGNGWSIDWWKR